MNKNEYKIIFLDRDGVINQSPGDERYVNSYKEFKFIEGSIEGIKKLYLKGYKIFIISNQSGVSKGLYTKKDLEAINDLIVKQLRKYKVSLSGIYYCTHNPQDNCNCRKPKTGLLEKAVSELGVKPKWSIFIGDTFKDMKAAVKFGAKAVLVLSGKEKIANRNSWEFEPEYIFKDLLAAATYISANYE
ncbi:MAG: D-glycero-beta-D-manno-heptose 1,7-bisphosphate 7-phosphatase [Candidatus Omnitrophica bacterium]|nr:D-glycero-beta-D-manno-heptose 1,7-bisphosphate 7-phosphatase [Candidatus Omnitrophota bacterium]